MEKLTLIKVSAYTINSSDDEIRSSDKGVYKSQPIAYQKSKKSGWYGSDGTVKMLDNIYEDIDGVLYSVKKIGKYTDVAENK